ncbi:group III truncated hemoglobin [Hoeflea ulvae]|uniref:Group III truncated hemoglobin n=1 Tax=Hoeflea ulvae TaxID=2983764 RepID=A0ABT3YER6_9HYPH|nr:group III truncated hemoglobin [Hoeflea ulvae]MCY0094369.1 group III truncated hemoglobin [Hoeflea ulvae]
MSERSAEPNLTARAAPPRTPAVAISPAEIGLLVDRFYDDIRAHPRLGPIFEERLAGKWDTHLDRMKKFWRSVLLYTGEYSGQPVVKHNALPDLQEDDFRQWLDLFEATTAALFGPPTVGPIVVIARRIARSLWLARFGTPFNQPPAWLG